MTRFIDGPAIAKALMLRRAPVFLRVTVEQAKSKVDALDQPEDTPRPEETIYAYVLTETPGMSFVRASGGRGGAYPMSNYALINPQPDDAILRDNAKWAAWVDAQPKPELLNQK